MADLQAFERSGRDTSRQLRRLPADLRHGLAADVQPLVADPLADKIAATFTGPWAAPLAGATKARKLADPTIIIGGAKRVVSGGANARQLVYGSQFGGGQRVGKITRKTRHGTTTYKAPTTRQFVRHTQETIFPTIRREGGWVLDQFAEIVAKILAGVTRG